MESPQPHPLHPSVVVPVRHDSTGLLGPTKAQAAGPFWRATSRGLFVPASVDADDPDQRVCEAGAVLPTYGGVTGWGGLRWGGGTYFTGVAPDGSRRPVVVAVMHGEIRNQPAILVTSERLPLRDLTTHDGLPITTHVRSVCYEIRYAASDREAVVIFDMATMDDLVSIEEVAAYVATLNGWTGVRRCRIALALADENSWSPMESRFRWIWIVVAELPRPLCNQPLFDRDGRHVGTPDLIDVEAGLVGEYEGGLHLEGARRGADLKKEAAYRKLGLEYIVMVSADWASPETTIVPRILEARGRSRFAAVSARDWTIEPPPWWTSTTTVAARRALTESQRAKLLRYRTG